jgi:hypothetical protein
MTNEEKAVQELRSFMDFAKAQKDIEKTLTGLLTAQGLNYPKPHVEYLTAKVSENLAMIFQKDFNDSRSWQSLASFVSVGAVNATAARGAIAEKAKTNAETMPTS